MDTPTFLSLFLAFATFLMLGLASLIFFTANQLTLREPVKLLQTFKAHPGTAISYCTLIVTCLAFIL